MHKNDYWEALESLYDVNEPKQLTYEILMSYCNFIMHDIDCDFFEALVYFMEENSELYDEFDIIEVLNDIDKKILKESLSVKYNIGREDNVIVF